VVAAGQLSASLEPPAAAKVPAAATEV
jgi:hypothetical protein